MDATKIGLACLWLAMACDHAKPPQAPPTRNEAQILDEDANADPTPAPVAAATPSAAPRPEEPRTIDVGPALVDVVPYFEELLPERPQAPADYGMLALSLPPPAGEELVVHAVAGYEVVAVYAEPDIESPKLGYVRLGTRMMVSEKQGTDGCPKGWYGLPAGGYACASKGLLVDAKNPPYFPKPPPPARLEEPLPYRYAYVRKWNSPMWWKVPSAAEQTQAQAERAAREAVREGKPLPGETKPATTAAPTTAADAKPTIAAPSVAVAKDEPATAALPAPAAQAKPPSETAPVVATADPVPEPPRLPLNPDNPWLEKGFFISLGQKVTEGDQSWWHTARGAYVEAEAAYEYDAKDFAGVELGEEVTFPFGWAMVEEAKVYELGEDGGLKAVSTLPRRTFVNLSEELELGGKTYMTTPGGQLLRKKDLRLAEAQPMPEGIEPWERWIDVSLAKQMLVAYEGDRPVYVTLVSTGRKGTKDEPFDTPPGRYRIRSKHVSTTMDGNSASDGNYSIQDVPWAMFFEGSYALHGAFWHDGFGRVRSHGCVNLGPSDARWIFMWSTPFLPEGWHGVHAHEGSPGTTVIVRE